MSKSLLDQLVDYGPQFEDALVPIQLDEAIDRTPRVKVAVPGPSERSRHLSLIAVGIGALILLLGAAFFFGRDAPEPAAPPSTDWGLALVLEDSIFPVGPRETFGDYVADAMEWPGVLEVVVVAGGRNEWVDLVGSEAAESICELSCDQGLVVYVDSAEALQAVLRGQLFGWYGTPRSVVHISSQAEGDLLRLGEERVAYFTAYLEAVGGVRGPAPVFDTTELGEMQLLVPGLVALSGDDGGRLSVSIEGHPGIHAVMTFPAIGSLTGHDFAFGEDTAGAIEISLSARAPENPLSTSGVSGNLHFMTTDPGLGLGLEILGTISWEGGMAFGVGGLPIQASAVATELPGGIRLWQIPVSGMAYFTVSGDFEDYLGTRGAPPITVYDREGNVILVNE